MAQVRAKWLTLYAEHVEPVSKEIFSHVEKMIIGTLIVSAGAHVSSTEPAIVLFGYLRHGLIGRGVMLFGVILLVLNFLDGLYKLAKLNWHVAYQIVMTILYVALSGGSIQLILAFRGGNTAADPVAAPHAAVRPTAWRTGDSTSLHAGESCAALVARHCTMRPPPGATPPQIERTSAPQADRSTNSSSRGRIGRSTITVGAAGAAAVAAPPRPEPRLPRVQAARHRHWRRRRPFSQPAESLALFFSRHCRAGAPPVGTPAQTFG